MTDAAGCSRYCRRQERCGAPGWSSGAAACVAARHLGAVAVDVGTLAGCVVERRCSAASGNQERAAAEGDRIGAPDDSAGASSVKVVDGAQSQIGVAVGADKGHDGDLACAHMLSMHVGNVRVG